MNNLFLDMINSVNVFVKKNTIINIFELFYEKSKFANIATHHIICVFRILYIVFLTQEVAIIHQLFIFYLT